MAGIKAKGGKKNRKFGRNKTWCERYRAEHRREKAKFRKITAHLTQHPEDAAAAESLKRYARHAA